MKRWILPLLLVASLGVNIGFLLHGVWPRIVGGAGAAHASTEIGWHAGPMRRHLDLSAEQARLMEGERRQVLARARPLQDELRLKRRHLLGLLKQDTISQADLDAALNELSRLQAAIEKLFVLHSLGMKGHFSPAQLDKFQECLERGLCPNSAAGGACVPGPAFRTDWLPGSRRNQQSVVNSKR